MKIIFDLEKLGLNDGENISRHTLNTILSFITSNYISTPFEKTQINSRKFSNITNEYKKYLDFLIDNDIIICNKHYQVGVFSRNYYFTDSFKEKIKVSKIKLNEYKTKKTIQNYIIPIDILVVKRLKRDFLSVKVNNNEITKPYKTAIKKEEYINFKSYLRSCINIEKVKAKNYHYNWKSGRLYTNFTFCSKPTRLNNFYFNKRLINLDIPNSFPLWLCIWSINKGIDTNCQEFKNFCTIVKNNTIYDILKDQLNILTSSDNIYTKIQAKNLFHRWLNGSKHTKLMKRMINYNYGCLYDLISNYNYQMYDELVRLETHFMMNILIKRLYKEINDIQILTCHDEIYFEDKYYNQILTIWNEEINKIYQLLPI